MLPTGSSNPPGVTRSERYLAQLCERSFLSLWSHPNLYRDRAKELADLVVIFGDHVIVFSDKSWRFDASSPHGWSRWYRESIAKSAKQLFRAEGWIRKHRDRVFLDSKCERRFPLDLPAEPRIHLVAVALGAADACRQHFGGGSGSLILSMLADGTTPFTVGDIDRTRPFVHVFDETSLDLVMSELDTVDDFVRYLSAKELFIRSGKLISAAGEEDLLACFLQRIDDKKGEHDFVFDGDPTGVIIDDFWEPFTRRPEYTAKKKADEVSYLWDRIIETIAKHVVSGTLIVGTEHSLSDHERGLRLMAAERRVARRGLSKFLEGLFARAHDGDMFARSMPASEKGHGYVFLTLRRSAAFGSEETYRAARLRVLQDYCDTVKLRVPETRFLVGLAFGAEPDDGSIDFVVTDFDGWTDEDARRADEIRQRRRWSDGSDLAQIRGQELEYPASPATPPQTASPTPERRADDGRRRREKRKAQRAARKKNRR